MKIRILLFFIFVGLFSLAYQIGAMSEVNEADAEQFLEEFEDLVGDIDAIGIFTHNLTIALPMFIPGFGIAWGMFSAGSTGFAFAAITSLIPELSELPPLAILYMSPFGIMELVAYSLAISRSFILIKMLIKKSKLDSIIKPTIAEIGIVIGLLIVGGYLEFYMINIAQETGNSMF